MRELTKEEEILMRSIVQRFSMKPDEVDDMLSECRYRYVIEMSKEEILKNSLSYLKSLFTWTCTDYMRRLIRSKKTFSKIKNFDSLSELKIDPSPNPYEMALIHEISKAVTEEELDIVQRITSGENHAKIAKDCNLTKSSLTRKKREIRYKISKVLL